MDAGATGEGEDTDIEATGEGEDTPEPDHGNKGNTETTREGGMTPSWT